MEREYEFDYGFWGMHPHILACGEKAFELLGEHFEVSSLELSDIEFAPAFFVRECRDKLISLIDNNVDYDTLRKAIDETMEG